MGLSESSIKVMQAFLADPRKEQYGFGLMRSTGVKSGSLYPILERFKRMGWLEDCEEVIDERAEGRPRRHLYRLTSRGEQEARRAVTDWYHGARDHLVRRMVVEDLEHSPG